MLLCSIILPVERCNYDVKQQAVAGLKSAVDIINSTTTHVSLYHICGRAEDPISQVLSSSYIEIIKHQSIWFHCQSILLA